MNELVILKEEDLIRLRALNEETNQSVYLLGTLRAQYVFEEQKVIKQIESLQNMHANLAAEIGTKYGIDLSSDVKVDLQSGKVTR